MDKRGNDIMLRDVNFESSKKKVIKEEKDKNI